MRLMWLGLCVLCLSTSACAGSSARPLTAAHRAPDTVFFVENHGKDQRGLEVVIARVIGARGYVVTAGLRQQRPAAFHLLVTYEDRWGWDMRNYLSKITIWVRNAQTGAIVAQAESHQGSMAAMGDEHAEIVERVAASLFGSE